MQTDINTIERNIDIKDIEDFRKLEEKRRQKNITTKQRRVKLARTDQ